MEVNTIVGTLFGEKKKVCELTSGDMVQVDKQLYTTIKEVKSVTVEDPIVNVVNGISLYNVEWNCSNEIKRSCFCNKLSRKHTFYNFVLTSGEYMLVNGVYIKTMSK